MASPREALRRRGDMRTACPTHRTAETQGRRERQREADRSEANEARVERARDPQLSNWVRALERRWAAIGACHDTCHLPGQRVLYDRQ